MFLRQNHHELVLTKVDAIFGVEACVVDEVDTAADHITSGERRAIGNARVGGTESVSIISMIAVGVLVPSC